MMAWGGFKIHSGLFGWLQLAGLLLLVISVAGWFLSYQKDRFARSILLLPPEEREQRLAAMSPKQREHILLWIRNHEV